MTVSKVIKGCLTFRSRPFVVTGHDSVLVLSPHPDDEALGCGGTLALLAKNGVSPFVVFLTDGGGSHPGHAMLSREDLAVLRAKEAHAAVSTLGIEWQRVKFLNFHDGMLATSNEASRTEMVAQIAKALSAIRPEVLLLPCRHDGSSEHDAAFLLVLEALGHLQMRPRILEFPVWSLWNPRLLLGPLFACRKVWRVDIGETRSAKAAAAASYLSQTHPIAPDVTSALPEGFLNVMLYGAEFLFEH
jgi:LmbE family N-acetylglucosaminyl deacetylase